MTGRTGVEEASGGPGIVRERVETTPPHGDVIRADVRRPARGVPRSAVIVAHGFKGFKDWGFFPYLCESLARDGHLVVSFNTSLNGVGPACWTSPTWKPSAATRSAARWATFTGWSTAPWPASGAVAGFRTPSGCWGTAAAAATA